MSDKNIPKVEEKTLDGLVSVLNTEKFQKLLNGYIYSEEYHKIPEREDLKAGHDCKLNVADCKSWLIASFLEAFKKKSNTIEMYKDKNLQYYELLPYLDKTEFSEDEVIELNKVVFGIDSIQEVIKLFVKAFKDNDKSVKQFDEESFNVLFKSISEEDKDKKILPYLSADFFCCFDSLDVNQIQLIMEKTDIEAGSDRKTSGYFITNVIRKLSKQEATSEQLLKFLFSVDNLEFNNNLECFYTTVTDLILHSKEYIDGNVYEAVRKVFSNSSPYEKLYKALCKISATYHDLFNIETMAESRGKDLAKMLLANHIFINFKDNVIQVGERDGVDTGGLVSLLSCSCSCTIDRQETESYFKDLEKLKTVKAMCIKKKLEREVMFSKNDKHKDKHKDIVLIYEELKKLGENVVYEKLNAVKLSFYDAKRLISYIQIAPESLEEKDFDNFKTAIENFSKCWPAEEHDSKLRLWELLMFFKEGSLTGEQICELLNLTTKAGIVEDKLYVDCVEIDWILSRLKPDELAPEQLLSYFCRDIKNAKCWFVHASTVYLSSVYEWGEEKIKKMRGNINNYFWSAIYKLIIHSEEYIKRDDNGEKAIRAVLGGVGRYAWFKHLIKESLNYKKSYKHECRLEGAITQLYNYKYREGDENSSIIKAFDDLLKANNLKISLGGEIEDHNREIMLEALDKNKEEKKNIENVEVEKGEEKKEDNSEKVDNNNVNENKNKEESNLNVNIKTNSENQGKKDEKINTENSTEVTKEVKSEINQENKRDNDKKVDDKKTEIGKDQNLNMSKEEGSNNDSNNTEEKTTTKKVKKENAIESPQQIIFKKLDAYFKKSGIAKSPRVHECCHVNNQLRKKSEDPKNPQTIQKSLNKNNFIPVTWTNNFWLSLKNLFFKIIGWKEKIIVGWYVSSQVDEQKNAKSISLPNKPVEKTPFRCPIMYDEYEKTFNNDPDNIKG